MNFLKNGHYCFLLALICLYLIGCEADSVSFSPSGSGIAGSTARFAIDGDHLYVVDRSNLKTFDISTESDPNFVNESLVGEGIETIFPYAGNLYLGARNGMYIYSLQDPSNPTTTSSAFFSHFTACDPVVVENSTAYVTLRASGSCSSAIIENSLISVDVSDPNNATEIATKFVPSPYGLGIDGETLFVCHGVQGLSVWDVSDPSNMTQVKMFDDISSIDVIPLNGLLLITGEDGIYQYNYDKKQELNLLSHIPVAG